MFQLQEVGRVWQEFFHQPQSPAALALFRIVWGALLAANAALLWKDIGPFFGPAGYLSVHRYRAIFGKSRFSLFHLLPETESSIRLVLLANLLASLSLAVGCCSRSSAAVAFLTMLSLHHRNPCVFHSGDTLMRLLTFLLIFSPSGERFSLDCHWSSTGGAGSVRHFAPYCERLMQIQISFLYLRTVFWKLRGVRWPGGTAAYYPTQLEAFQRISLPTAMCAPIWVRFATWGTLVVQLSLAVLVWFEETRYPTLLAGVLLHLTFELFLNLQLFSWTMLASYLLFLRPFDAEAIIRFVTLR